MLDNAVLKPRTDRQEVMLAPCRQDLGGACAGIHLTLLPGRVGAKYVCVMNRGAGCWAARRFARATRSRDPPERLLLAVLPVAGAADLGLCIHYRPLWAGCPFRLSLWPAMTMVWDPPELRWPPCCNVLPVYTRCAQRLV